MEKELKIYLVEYSAEDIKLIKDSLTEYGINCSCVETDSTEKAMEMLSAINERNATETPDLILSEIQSAAGKNNIPFIKQLKDSENLRLIPLIIFSTAKSQDVINEVYLYHANCFIQKPSEPEKYNESLKEMWNFWLETVRLPTSQRKRSKPINTF